MEEICRLTNHEATQVYELIEKKECIVKFKKATRRKREK